MDALFRDAPCPRQAFAEGCGGDDGEGVAVVAFSGRRRRRIVGGFDDLKNGHILLSFPPPTHTLTH